MSPSLAASAALANSWLSMRYSARARRAHFRWQVGELRADLALGDLHVGLGDLLAVDRGNDLGRRVFRLGRNGLRCEGYGSHGGDTREGAQILKHSMHARSLNCWAGRAEVEGETRGVARSCNRKRASPAGCGPMDSGGSTGCQVKNSTVGGRFFAVCAARRSVSDALTSLWCGPYLSPAAEIHASQALQARSAAVCCVRGPVNLGCYDGFPRGQTTRTTCQCLPARARNSGNTSHAFDDRWFCGKDFRLIE